MVSWHTRLAVLLALAAPTLSQTPPGFSPQAASILPIAYSSPSLNPKFIVNGAALSKNTVQSEPIVYVPAALANQTFTLLMLDPDAPSPRNNSLSQVLHWLQPGLRATPNTQITGPDGITTLLQLGTTFTAAIAPYLGPAPPSQEPHRYIFLLFAQRNSTFALPDGFERFQGGADRLRFDADPFTQAAGLGAPILGNFLLVGASARDEGIQGTTSTIGLLEPGAVTTPLVIFNTTAGASSGLGPSLTSTSNSTWDPAWSTTSAGPAFAGTGAPTDQNSNGSAFGFPTPSPTQTKNEGAKIASSMSISLGVAVALLWLAT
ncbi:hypothetical protein DRE_04174 [Drechslerella stenobrocha 248]|uniref:PEBP-like protein n=1 Tax=Drechslerella stenobrocha 248 TaxID=1043628 RepID=W7I2P6_9PEZI|nr:hypothetical protein DRE_04174 [Drechslerella stenobrocha 248]